MAHSLTMYRISQNHVLCILTVVLMLMPLFSASAQTSESSPNRVISEIQRLLNTNGCASISVNGELNSETVGALNEYLRIKGLNDITALSAGELLTMLLSEDRAACLSTEPHLPSTNQITAQIPSSNTPETTSGPSFTIQIASFSELDNANNSQNTVRSLGLEPRTEQATVNGRRVWRVLVIGNAQQDPNSVLRLLNENGFPDAFFRTRNN